VSCAAPHVALALLGGVLGMWLIVLGMIVWSCVDKWWFHTGQMRFRKWKLGHMKPLIVQRWLHVYGPEFAGKHGAFWCITRDRRDVQSCTALYRAGQAHSPEIAYARWRYNPKFWQGSHPVLKWQ
jgi:hypothetical protein